MNEYHQCISLAVSLGKSLEEARREWTEVNSIVGPDYNAIHAPWDCCQYE